VGDTLAFKGPLPKYKYAPNIKKEIGMIAGGTGITPMLQVGLAEQQQMLSLYACGSKAALLWSRASVGLPQVVHLRAGAATAAQEQITR